MKCPRIPEHHLMILITFAVLLVAGCTSTQGSVQTKSGNNANVANQTNNISEQFITMENENRDANATIEPPTSEGNRNTMIPTTNASEAQKAPSILPNASMCKKIYGDGKRSGTLNIYFVGVGYEKNQIFYAGTPDLQNFSKNLENDINRFLYSPDKYVGFGLLTVEPFSSHKDRINAFMVTSPYSCAPNCTGTNMNNISKLVMDSCDTPNDFPYDQIVPIIGYDRLTNYMINQNSVYRQQTPDFRQDYVNTVSTFVHEFGHSLGLLDNYGSAYDQHPAPMKDGGPNCDPTPGCPKWCSGKIATPYTEQAASYQKCRQHANEQDCSADRNNDCLWLGFMDPYFESKCVRNYGFKGDFKNIGVDCTGGEGCYWGCYAPGGYRPRDMDQLTDERIDPDGTKHHYSLVAERYLINKYWK